MLSKEGEPISKAWVSTSSLPMYSPYREGNSNPLQYSHLEKSMDRGAWAIAMGYSPWSLEESDMTE